MMLPVITENRLFANWNSLAILKLKYYLLLNTAASCEGKLYKLRNYTTLEMFCTCYLRHEFASLSA